MSLSNQELSDIAKEFSVVKSDQADSKAAIPNLQKQVDQKQEQVKRAYIPYNNAQISRVDPYEIERQWLDGNISSPLTQSQIETFGSNGKSTYFFPDTWLKNNAKLMDNGNGNPKTTNTSNESTQLNNSLDNQGLIATINFLRNGQTSSEPSNTLDASYSPGATTITVTTSGNTNGNLLYIAGSGTSALVRITNASGTTLTITELIAPANTIASSGTVIENIPGFTNTERNTLVSTTYQRILTQLTTRITTVAAIWNTALLNQLAQLNINIDAAAQITTAKTNVNTALTAYNTWLALSNTGTSGKFVNSSLDNLATAYNTRNSLIPTRVGQITTALGSVSQDGEGNFSGNGLYLQRYKCMNFLINMTDGALFQANSMKSLKGTSEQKVANASDKMATYSNLVRYAISTADPSGNKIAVDAANQFSSSDNILLTANDLPGISCTISSISGSSVTLSITIPKEYTKAAKAGIIKQI
jgi:hypothetical protein